MASLYYNYQNLHGFALLYKLGCFFNKTSLGLPILNIKEKKIKSGRSSKKTSSRKWPDTKGLFSAKVQGTESSVSVVLRHMDNNSFQRSTDLKSSRTARAAITGTAFLKRKKAKI